MKKHLYKTRHELVTLLLSQSLTDDFRKNIYNILLEEAKIIDSAQRVSFAFKSTCDLILNRPDLRKNL